jgi:hypothetical protein
MSLVVAALCIPVSAGLTINEILADPGSGLSGDANGDGVRSGAADEFIEIVYDTPGSALDLSGWTLSDATSVRHLFPGGTWLDPYSAIVVFGGGSPVGDFGGALVQIASSGGLGLNNSSDTVTLSDGAGMELTVAYGSEAGDDQSITLDPDITGSFVKHITAAGSGGVRFSPGTMVGGLPFSLPDAGSDPDPGTIPGPTTVPVPGALALAVLGLCGMAGRRPQRSVLAD